MLKRIRWYLQFVFFGIGISWAVHALVLDSWLQPLFIAVISFLVGLTIKPAE